MDESGCYVFLTHEVVGAIHHNKSVEPGLKPNGEIIALRNSSQPDLKRLRGGPSGPPF